jgi:hypothetical protein
VLIDKTAPTLLASMAGYPAEETIDNFAAKLNALRVIFQSIKKSSGKPKVIRTDRIESLLCLKLLATYERRLSNYLKE